jgi:hypothetical protein
MAMELSRDLLDALAEAANVRRSEQVWPDLCCHLDSMISIDWRADVLRERAQPLADGSAIRMSWF